jgi:hypothetical protein
MIKIKKTSLDVWAVSLIVTLALLVPVFGQEKNDDSLEADRIRVEEYIAFLGSLPEELVAFYYPDGITDQIIATPLEDRIDYERASGVDREELMHGLTGEQREGFDRWYHQSDPLMMFYRHLTFKHKGQPVDEHGQKEEVYNETDDFNFHHHIELSRYQNKEQESLNNSKADSDEHDSQNSVHEKKKISLIMSNDKETNKVLINAQKSQSSSFQTQKLVSLSNPKISNELVLKIKMTEYNYIKGKCTIENLLKYWEFYFKHTKAKYNVQSQSSNSLPSTTSSSYTSTDSKLENQRVLDYLNNINPTVQYEKLCKWNQDILKQEDDLNQNICLINNEINIKILDPFYNLKSLEELLSSRQIFQGKLEDISAEKKTLNKQFSLINNISNELKDKAQQINFSPEGRRFAIEREYFSKDNFKPLLEEYQIEIQTLYQQRLLLDKAISKINQNVQEAKKSVIVYFKNALEVAGKVVGLRARLLLAPPYHNEFTHQDKDSLGQLKQEHIRESVSLISGRNNILYPNGKRVEDYDCGDITELFLLDES